MGKTKDPIRLIEKLVSNNAPVTDHRSIYARLQEKQQQRKNKSNTRETGAMFAASIRVLPINKCRSRIF